MLDSVVLETLRRADPARKAWRLVGGVLVEKAVSEVVPDLETHSAQMEALLETLFKRIQELEQEMRSIEEQLGVRSNRPAAQSSGQQSAGVLIG